MSAVQLCLVTAFIHTAFIKRFLYVMCGAIIKVGTVTADQTNSRFQFRCIFRVMGLDHNFFKLVYLFQYLKCVISVFYYYIFYKCNNGASGRTQYGRIAQVHPTLFFKCYNKYCTVPVHYNRLVCISYHACSLTKAEMNECIR